MRNLLGRLIDRPPRSLAEIAQFWEVGLRGRDAYQDVGHLYRVLTDPWSYALVQARLGPIERAIIKRLSEAGEALSGSAIAAELALGDDEVGPALERLDRAGLVYPEREQPAGGAEARFFLPRELAHLDSRLAEERRRREPAGDDPRQLLDWLDDSEVSEIAQHLGYRIVPAVAARPDMIEYIVPRLGDPDRISVAIRGLDPLSARLWEWLEQQAGLGDPSAARRDLDFSGANLRQALRSLTRYGLVWRVYTEHGDPRMFVPAIVRTPRRAPVPPPPPLVSLSEPTDSSVDPLDWIPAHGLAWDLLTLLRDIASGTTSWQQPAGDRNAAALRRLAPRLWLHSGDMPPAGYVPFLLILADGLGLIGTGGSGIVSDRLRAWTRASFSEQMRRLAGLWRDAIEWPEAASREALQVWGADWPAFRRQLLSMLAELEPGTWYTLESVTSRFAATSPAALGSHFTAAANHEPADESPEARRLSVVRLAAEMTLTTAAAWFGIVEISRARRRGVVLRRTGADGWLFDEDGQPPEQPTLGAHTLAVQPSFEVFLLRPAPRYVWALSAFTDLEQLDRVSIYRLTQRSIQRGLASGQNLERLVGFLEQQSGETLPQNVAYEVERWASEYRRVRLQRALLVEPDDHTSLDAIEAALKGDGLGIERLNPDRLLILASDDGDAVERVETLLRAIGQTPHWVGGV